jgi:hypothetical protein
MGRKGLESIENVGPKMAGVIEDLLITRTEAPWGQERPDLLG